MLEQFKDWYINKMQESTSFTEARTYAKAAGYDIGQLIKDRYFKEN